MNTESELFSVLNNDIKAAMKSGDKMKRDCLRSIVSDIKNATVNAGKDINDDICIKILQKSAKSHSDSIAQFKSANRKDLVDKESAELDIIKAYLPKLMSEEQMQSVILKIVADNQIEEKKENLGKVMKILSGMPIKKNIDMKKAKDYLTILMK